ncbi:MAG: SPOR domain-containing protein [Paracoccaceae bacterium]
MAYETYVDSGAEPVFHHPSDPTLAPQRTGLKLLMNVAAAAISIGLVVGVGVWGYSLMMRDVTGIPVVRAIDGDMRVRPENSGGELARHQGLAVNAVAAEGGAQASSDRVILAPQPVQLTGEDVPMDDQAVAVVQQAISDNTLVTTDAQTGATPQLETARVTDAAARGSVEDLVAALIEGAAPLDLTEENDTVRVAAIGTESVAAALQAVPGVKASLRPQLRPKRVATRVAATSADVKAALQSALSTASTLKIDPNSLPSGTRLAQLGAYDTQDMAVEQWNKAAAQFGDLMSGKAQVVQQASSGGRTFYRLRAHGFEDLADARRFCSALIAEGGDCIPVVTR